MHLKPRVLAGTAAATLAACTLVGVVGSFDRPAIAANAVGAPETPVQPQADPSGMELSSSISAEPHAPATQSPQLSSVAPTLPMPDPPSSPQAISGGPPETSDSASGPSDESTSDAPARQTKPRETAPPPRPTTDATQPALPAPEPRRTSATGSWQAPTLRVGTNTITRPQLTSGARVSVTVACSPGAGCSMSGTQLDIAPGTAVTVTWSAPARQDHAAWRASRVL